MGALAGLSSAVFAVGLCNNPRAGGEEGWLQSGQEGFSLDLLPSG